MLQRMFGPVLMTSFMLLAADGGGGGGFTPGKYESLTVPLLQKEILDREIEGVEIKDMLKKDLIAVLVKDDEERGGTKFIVPTFEEYAKAYPDATQDGYTHRFCGFIAGQEATELEIDVNQKIEGRNPFVHWLF